MVLSVRDDAGCVAGRQADDSPDIERILLRLPRDDRVLKGHRVRLESGGEDRSEVDEEQRGRENRGDHDRCLRATDRRIDPTPRRLSDATPLPAAGLATPEGMAPPLSRPRCDAGSGSVRELALGPALIERELVRRLGLARLVHGRPRAPELPLCAGPSASGSVGSPRCFRSFSAMGPAGIAARTRRVAPQTQARTSQRKTRLSRSVQESHLLYRAASCRDLTTRSGRAGGPRRATHQPERAQSSGSRSSCSLFLFQTSLHEPRTPTPSRVVPSHRNSTSRCGTSNHS